MSLLPEIPLRTELYWVILGCSTAIHTGELQLYLCGAWINSLSRSRFRELVYHPAICKSVQAVDWLLHHWTEREAKRVCRKARKLSSSRDGGRYYSDCLVSVDSQQNSTVGNVLACLGIYGFAPAHTKYRGFNTLYPSTHTINLYFESVTFFYTWLSKMLCLSDSLFFCSGCGESIGRPGGFLVVLWSLPGSFRWPPLYCIHST